jgi:hypothetical protein
VIRGPMRLKTRNGMRPVLLLVVLALISGQASGRTLRFPLANDACPTSSFGSWRAGHLHAGLDFSTGGVTGVPVLAVDSCRVWRISLWNGGYGKALYVELADGKTAVYGHLSRFIPEIESLVEARQDLEGRYEVELVFEPDRLRFGPGDILAYSGETGSGPPHLHFELRSGRDEHDKINPVPDFMDLAEGFSPVIKSVRIEPLEAGSSVNGVYGPVTVRAGKGPDTLMICGAFGVSVEAVDPVQCGRILLPVLYEASIDGIPVWKLDLDRFPFAKGHFVGGLYELIGGAKFVRLFDPFDLDYAGFTCLKPARPAESGLPLPGRHEFTIRVGDAWGNTDAITLPFVYGAAPAFRRFGLVQAGGTVRIEVEPEPRGSAVELACRSGGTWQPLGIEEGRDGLVAPGACSDSLVEVLCRLRGESGLEREGVLAIGGGRVETGSVRVRTAVHRSFVEILGESASPPSSLPVGRVYCGAQVDSVIFQPAGTNLFRATYVPRAGNHPLTIETEFGFGDEIVRDSTELAVGLLEPGGEVWLSGESYRLRLRSPETYSSRTLVSLSEAPGEIRKGFEAVAGRLVLQPADGFFNDMIEVTVEHKQGGFAGRCGVFAETGGWVAFRGRFDRQGRCEFRMRQPEPLVILEDGGAPDIDQVKGFMRRAADGKAVFSSRITDRGSGVDAGSLKAFVDGEVAIVAIDPDTGLVSGRTTKALPLGEHRIRLEAEDRMGNRAGREFTVDLSR